MFVYVCVCFKTESKDRKIDILREAGLGDTVSADDASAIFCETIMLLAAKILVSDSSRAVWQSFVSLCGV